MSRLTHGLRVPAALAVLILPVLFVAGSSNLDISAPGTSGEVAPALSASSGDLQGYIVQATTADTAAALVRSVGGELTHDLPIINAVGARLTAAQADALSADSRVRGVLADRAVKVSSGSSAETVRDEFNERTYKNDDGTREWLTRWIEINGTGKPMTGAMQVLENGRLRICRPDRLIKRSAYLPAHTAATLSFDWRRVAFKQASHSVTIKISADAGSTWTRLATFGGAGTDAEMQHYSVDISDFASAETVLRFGTSNTLTTKTRFEIDNVQIEYTDDVVSVDIYETLLDTFDARDYAASEGTVDWSGPWTEEGDDGEALTGLFFIKDIGKLRIAGADVSLTRSADLSEAGSAQLTFDHKRYTLDDAGDVVTLEVSTDGGTVWTELDRYAGPDNDEGFLPGVYDLSAFAGSTTAIRFRSSATMTETDRFIVDNVKIAYSTSPDSYFPTLVDADDLHAEGTTGAGVTVAVLDTGHFAHDGLDLDASGQNRVAGLYDAINDVVVPAGTSNDDNGHGVHISSVAVSSIKSTTGRFNGVAPGARLVSVKAFDAAGAGTYLDVIRGIDWVVANKDTLGIRVLNLSLSAEPLSHYWDDPLNQAVMAAWDAGIVVVTSAGNTGPDPMTVGVPGNVPYVITVGALSDRYSPDDLADDVLATFSSAGPTYEGFVKPEIVAPGGHILGLMPLNAHLATAYPEFQNAASYFAMSGTSQAAAVVSGIVALMLEAHPSLSPDDVKCRLLSTAKPAVTETGEPGYSMFQQGSGAVNAYAAVHSTETECANVGLDLAADLAGSQHYAGPARQDTDGNYYIEGLDGYTWGGAQLGGDGFLWRGLTGDGFLWGGSAFNASFTWGGSAFNDSFLWGGGGVFTSSFTWSGTVIPNSYTWGGGEGMFTNVWVDQE